MPKLHEGGSLLYNLFVQMKGEEWTWKGSSNGVVSGRAWGGQCPPPQQLLVGEDCPECVEAISIRVICREHCLFWWYFVHSLWHHELWTWYNYINSGILRGHSGFGHGLVMWGGGHCCCLYGNFCSTFFNHGISCLKIPIQLMWLHGCTYASYLDWVIIILSMAQWVQWDFMAVRCPCINRIKNISWNDKHA